MKLVDLASPLLEAGVPTLDHWHDFVAAHPDAYGQYRYGRLPYGGRLHPSFAHGSDNAKREIDQIRHFGPVIESTISELVSTPLDLTVVLMIGAGGSNGFSGTYRGQPAVFMCPEFTFLDDGLRVLLAHEFAHAAHESTLAPDSVRDHDFDALFGAWFEGLAVEVSVQVCPGFSEDMYYWFGLEGFDDWPAQCASRRAATTAALHAGNYDALFLGGAVDDCPRTGYWLGHQLVKHSGLSIPTAMAIRPSGARELVLDMITE